MTDLNFSQFYKASNPSRPIQDSRYYINFSEVRGGDIVEELARTIAELSPDEPTTQLLTGHVGSGKSTELFRLRDQLEAAGYHVVYFESDVDLELADVEVTDILLVMARQISASLENIGISLRPSYFQQLFQSISNTLRMPMEVTDVSLSVGIANITAQSKESTDLRSQLHQYLEPRTKNLLDAINQELLNPAIAQLQSQGKAGLVAIVDNLDRVFPNLKPGNRPQPQYLFIDRADQLKRLDCHVIYTIPISLAFSDDFQILKERFGFSPSVLTMVPIRTINGLLNESSMDKLRQMVMARAYPDLPESDRLDRITSVFDDPSTLSRLCMISGGHMRSVLRYVYGCLRKQRPPISGRVLEQVIRDERNDMLALIDEKEWQLLTRAAKDRTFQGDNDYNSLLRNLFLYEYRDDQGRWVDVNPVLAETEVYRQWRAKQDQL
ncbi:AAA family ATPase [Oscillatoria sp. CS-180]|uniref:P-loop NTPase fold protein n=1 Tax=Oscillatoria sp. CS-180 TaxID=3021720 RepID=UPI00232C6B4E|nr:P-loop NTPase fold protein [Oscillatoria sp. CS-180]MDB9524935.1 AAA family ATPase [Oscillatoria sp. CS-180]